MSAFRDAEWIAYIVPDIPFAAITIVWLIMRNPRVIDVGERTAANLALQNGRQIPVHQADQLFNNIVCDINNDFEVSDALLGRQRWRTQASAVRLQC